MRCLRCGDSLGQHQLHSPEMCEARLDEKIGRRIFGVDLAASILAPLYRARRQGERAS